ncbi:MAG TPA: lysylphosphatidylglycerol synthase transmembrane domain-containing protein [Acidimicrobiales bacterium]|nr:lysylphosphatidylglycerol synthase transmembrane domain-containing protein [Acidimicrobiales bacterium]
MKWVRRVLALVILIAAVVAASTQTKQLERGASLLTHMRWGWLVVAVVFELASLVVFARLQRWLLHAGGVRLGFSALFEITLAGNSLAVTLPGGAVWAAAFAYEQLRRRGADRVLAEWVILVAGALSSFALFCILASGVWVAGSTGPVASLRWLAVALAAIPVLAGTVSLAVRYSSWARRASSSLVAWAERIVPRSGRAADLLRLFWSRVRRVRPGAIGWLVAFALAMANWLCNCATLIACTLALGAPVHWRGVLVAYALAQISASLPITPGGIGVVEGSLTFALIAYGQDPTQAVAIVLLYRIVSFWGVVPLGWLSWAYLALQQRRGRRRGKHHPWAIHHRQRQAQPASPTDPRDDAAQPVSQAGHPLSPGSAT